MALPEELRIRYPPWVMTVVDFQKVYASRHDRMRLAIALAKENVTRRSGGPFGAVVFEADSGRVIAPGMNLVVSHNNSTLHAEMVACMMAQSRMRSYTLRVPAGGPYQLVTSCDPCAMCLGAILWSGISEVVAGATGDDARSLGFEEGPVFHESFAYLESRGIGIVRGVLRSEAKEALDLYKEIGGIVYNA